MILTLIAALLAALPAGPAQVTGASRTALVTVSDGRGRPLVDLGPDDFVVTESGAAREILDVRVADYPLVILIDTGHAARDQFADIRKAVERFIARLGQRPIAVGTLGDPPAMIASFEDERRVMLQRLDALAAKPAADTLVLQTAAGAARTLSRDAPLFSAIVIVSATSTDGSRDNVAELINPIVDGGVIVHAVVNAPGPGAPTSGPMEAVRRLSSESRGLFTTIYSPASYQAALDHLADRLAAELMVGYLVPPGSAATDAQVGVRIPGARTRGLGVRPLR